MRIFDVTVPISDSIAVWPGDAQPAITRRLQIEQGDDVNLSDLRMSAHTGTHVDVPFHVLPNGATLDQIPLEQLVGKATVVEINDTRAVTRDELIQLSLQRVERVLFKTRNSQSWREHPSDFQKEFVYIDAEAALYLVELGVRLVGIDYLSVDSFFAEELTTHLRLLRNNIVIIEGLDLSSVPSGEYTLFCLPMKVNGADGAPARVVLVESDS